MLHANRRRTGSFRRPFWAYTAQHFYFTEGELGLQQDIQLDRRSIIKLLIPVMIDQIFIASLPMINTVIISMLGQASMSGVSIIDQVNQLITITVSAVGMGAAVMVAQYVGRDDRVAVARVIKQSYSFSMMISLLSTALMLVFSSQVAGIALKGAEPEMLAIGRTYLAVTCLSYPFFGFYSNTTQVLRSMGETRKAMFMSILMNAGTMMLSLTFIYGFKLGIYGAAYASLGGRILGTLLGMYFVMKTHICRKLSDFFGLRLDFATVKMLIRMGLPAGVQSFFFIGARLVMNRFILPYGTDHISANVVFTQLLDLQCTGSSVVLSMAPAIMGIAKGRGDQDGIRQAFKDLGFLAFWFGVPFALLPLPFLDFFMNLYHLKEAAAVIASKMIFYNPLYIIPFVWFAGMAPSAFRGIGDSVVPPFITAGCLWVGRVGTIALLCTYFNFGAYASYFAVMNDYLLRNILYFWRYRSGAWLRAQRGVDGRG